MTTLILFVIGYALGGLLTAVAVSGAGDLLADEREFRGGGWRFFAAFWPVALPVVALYAFERCGQNAEDRRRRREGAHDGEGVGGAPIGAHGEA